MQKTQQILELNDTIEKWTSQTSTEYSILQQHNIPSSQQAHESFSKVDHILGHKASLNKHSLYI
jgi:uncharacterized protein with PIN domain